MDLISRVEMTVIIGICWLAGMTLLLAFNPAGLNILQSLAAVIASGIIAVGALALTWIHK